MDSIVVGNGNQGNAIERFLTAFDKVLALNESDPASRVAFDCEGVNLCHREGVDHAQHIRCFQALMTLFESPHVVKVIHDCCIDCDALHHLHGIALVNVHETSCHHAVSTEQEISNLNAVLECHGSPSNAMRGRTIHRRNLSYWASRPLTKKMITWASSDVNKLLCLAEMQLSTLSDSEVKLGCPKSQECSTMVCDMQLQHHVPCRGNMGDKLNSRFTAMESG